MLNFWLSSIGIFVLMLILSAFTGTGKWFGDATFFTEVYTITFVTLMFFIIVPLIINGIYCYRTNKCIRCYANVNRSVNILCFDCYMGIDRYE